MPSAGQRLQNQVDLPRIGATVLIAIGLIWLMASFGIIASASISILFRYWPLVLVGLGMDYFSERSSQLGVSYTVIAIGALIFLMLTGPMLGLAKGANVVTEQFREPLGSAQSARVVLDLASAPTTIVALSDSSQLIDAELTHIGTVKFDVRGDREKNITLKRDARGFNFGLLGFNQTKWEIGLSPQVPLALQVNVGSGSARLNLDTLELSTLSLNGGSGSLNLDLPASTSSYLAELKVGSGSSQVTVLDNARLDLKVDVASGSFRADLGKKLDLSFELRGGSGSSHIQLPEDAAIRLEVSDDGSGSLNVGGQLERLSGSGDEGVWETPDFRSAQAQIVIKVLDAGSGSITIR